MTRIRPFRALRYDPGRVDLDRVVAPPYDVIAPRDRASYFDRDPHNAIRLTLTREVEQEATTDYSEIRRTLDAWRTSAVLVRDASPALYGLRERFVAPDGSAHVRDAFFALLHLEDYERRIVRPHELTLAGPKADRLKLLRAAGANLSSVLVLYEDRDGELDRVLAPALDAEPVAEARDPAGSHRLTRMADRASVEAVCAFLSERPVVIADGHHRYETALKYRDECPRGGDGPPAWMLAWGTGRTPTCTCCGVTRPARCRRHTRTPAAPRAARCGHRRVASSSPSRRTPPPERLPAGSAVVAALFGTTDSLILS